MSSVLKFGKDTVILATKKDHEEPSTVQLPEIERPPGLILPNGEINWNCPCLGGMPTGPCGVEFRESFTCFHNSKAESRGDECYESFAKMQDCFSKYPGVYKLPDDEDDIDNHQDNESQNTKHADLPENNSDQSVVERKK